MRKIEINDTKENLKITSKFLDDNNISYSYKEDIRLSEIIFPNIWSIIQFIIIIVLITLVFFT